MFDWSALPAILFMAFTALAVGGGVALVILGIIEQDKRMRAAKLEQRNLERAAQREYAQAAGGVRTEVRP